MSELRFYCGTHMPSWLRFANVPPLFVSHRRLTRYKTLPTATGLWALDSGGFTELSMYGGWRTTPDDYITAVRRYKTEIGGMDWAAPQDWMCEPFIVDKTGMSVGEHQERTVTNFLDLTTRAPDLPFIPVLQGWTLEDYRVHVGMYAGAGVCLPDYGLVGLGSVCRRQATNEIGEIVAMLADGGIRLHGFGVKSEGIQRYGWLLASADSMSWSYAGRRIVPCPHSQTRSNCANCYPHAMEWRARAVRSTARPVQTRMF